MGMFSGKKKTYVGVQVERMMPDDQIVDLHQAALLDYTLGNNKRVDALATTFNDIYKRHLDGSIGSKALERWAWAKKRYHYGVMEGQFIKEEAINLPAIFENYMATLGKWVTVDMIKFGPINNHHAVYQKLQDHFGYDGSSNELTVLSLQNGFKTYLEDFTINYCTPTINDVINPSYLNALGYPATHGQTDSRICDITREHTPWVANPEAQYDYADVVCSYKKADGTIVYNTIRLDFQEYELSDIEMNTDGYVAPEDAVGAESFYMVRYIENNLVKYFTYQYMSSGIVVLDNAISGDTDPGKYLPQIYVALDRKKLNQDKESEGYKSSRAYCNSIDLNYDNTVDELWNAIGANEGNVKDILISHRVAANSDDPIINKYLYHLFYELYIDSGAVPVRSDYTEEYDVQVQTQEMSGQSIVLRDKLSYFILSFTGISCQVKSGVIGPVGTASGGLTDLEVDFQGLRRALTHVHTYRLQISENTYREVHVRGLRTTQKVSGGHAKDAAGSDEALLIPIDVDIVRKRVSKHRHELLCKSIHIIITTVQVVKQKWYQTGIFKVVMFIIAVIVAFFTYGQGLYWYIALIKAIAITVAVTVAVNLVARLLVSMGVDGGLVMAVIAVIAIILGSYAYVTNGSVAGLNAAQYMAIANHSFAISNQATALMMEKRYKAFLEFQDMAEERLNELEKLRKDLGLDDAVIIDMFTLLSENITTPDIRIGESPISFLERTTSVDAGKLPLAVVNNFAYITTTLPTFESIMYKRMNQYV